MPATALLSAVVESSVNRLLQLDPDSQARLAQLQGARLIAFIDPLPQGVMLVFSDQVDVLMVTESFDEVVAQLGSQDCCIKTALQTLPELKNTNMLTRLIQQNKLQVEGELAVAQKVSGLFQQLDIDVEEIVAGYTNDIIAHQSMRVLEGVKQQAQRVFANLATITGNALVEEKQLAAHRLAVMHFSDEVNSIRDDVAKLEARLQKLEQQ
jgi:ubiquinone biosynthesis protein UbiJ